MVCAIFRFDIFVDAGVVWGGVWGWIGWVVVLAYCDTRG